MLNKYIKISLLCTSMFMLAACTTASDNGRGAGVGGNSSGANANGATSSGAGNMTSFNGQDQANNKALQVGNQSYYFDFNQSNVNNNDQQSIKVQANYLNAHPKAKVLLAGNTDERGSREYNIGLGNQRSNSIEAILEADGVNKNQISTVSYGAEKPVATGHDESAWSQNRRVDLSYQTSVNGTEKNTG